MAQSVIRIRLASGMFGVNCYAVVAGQGFVLVDTGMRKQRAALEEKLGVGGVGFAALRLILITHGDSDHIGSAAYLREKSGAPIAMHSADVPMSAKGDMFAGRKRPNPLIRALLWPMLRFPREYRFEPDLLVDEDTDLTEYGLLGARILVLRGHSAGSIGLLLPDGSLLCGDILENRKEPRLGAIMDDAPTARASVERLKTLGVDMVYPGHGEPFHLRDLA